MITPEIGPLSEFLQVPPEWYKLAIEQSIDVWQSRKKRKQEQEREQLRITVTKLHQDGIIAAFLYKYYDLESTRDGNLFRLGGWTYPLYIEPNWSVNSKEDEVLEQPLARQEYRIGETDHFQKAKSAYLDYLTTMGRVRHDGQTFRLLEVLSVDNGFKLQCGPGSYFNYLATCESLADELVLQLYERKVYDKRVFAEHAHLQNNVKLFESIRKSLHSRSLFAPTLQKLTKVSARDCKIGLNIFLALDTASGPVCFIYHRGKNVAEYPDINHVMPAGTFQHDGRTSLVYEQYKEAYSIRYKVLSELWEECFEGKELKVQRKMLYGGRIDFDDAKIPTTDLRPVVDLMESLEKGTAFLYVTGLGLDLLSAKPELTVALIINDKSFAKKYHDYWKFNWEFQGFGTDNEMEGIHVCHLGDRKSIRELLQPGQVIPAGAMAVERGFTLIHKMSKEGQLDWNVPEL